ncbi:helix-turn-helix domain-containing protein [Streptomyces zagrosensis]|uniref:Transcriptional regulator with XRE-family HTH domain n=1 Tax=Streptomyces zagrosensis TaxID=1042984 RepID=A0A7W9Q8T1_9ACTN|nr:helix-turn-helix domain-containing protein [Streptomyces zagrosensis]MBB5935725.1 transcriptional regulator with XRE-family HTH domain [Streptomyces zagrosensis]
MAEGTDTLGDRVCKLRKRRGLSQRELATASKVSLATVRQLEQGNAGNTRMETARALAAALRVPTTELMRLNPPEEMSPDSAPWQPLERAVVAPRLTFLDDEPTIAGLTAGMEEARRLHTAKQMADEVMVLAPLLRDADALGTAPEVRSVRAQLLHMAGALLTQARQFEGAETALRRALDDAPDHVRAASIIATWAWLLMRQGRLGQAREMAQQWADDCEPKLSRAPVESIAAWGWLLLHGASASLRDARDGEADDMMRLARAAATVTGTITPSATRPDPWGPVVVAYKAAEKGVILDRPDDVLRAGQRLKGTGEGQETDYHRHRLDVARAYTMVRKYTEAAEVLGAIHCAQPEWLAQQPYAQDTMGRVIERRRTLTPEMRKLADALSVPM